MGTFSPKPRDFPLSAISAFLLLTRRRKRDVELMGVAVSMSIAAEMEEDEGTKTAAGLRRRLVRRIYWKLRAEIRRRSCRRQRFSSRYDPFSYALNFDDGDPYF